MVGLYEGLGDTLLSVPQERRKIHVSNLPMLRVSQLFGSISLLIHVLSSLGPDPSPSSIAFKHLAFPVRNYTYSYNLLHLSFLHEKISWLLLLVGMSTVQSLFGTRLVTYFRTSRFRPSVIPARQELSIFPNPIGGWLDALARRCQTFLSTGMDY